MKCIERKGRPYYTTNRLTKPVYSRGDLIDVNLSQEVAVFTCLSQRLWSRPPSVIPSLLSGQALSAAKDLRAAQREILRCAQDDSSAEVHAYGVTLAVVQEASI